MKKVLKFVILICLLCVFAGENIVFAEEIENTLESENTVDHKSNDNDTIENDNYLNNFEKENRDNLKLIDINNKLNIDEKDDEYIYSK